MSGDKQRTLNETSSPAVARARFREGDVQSTAGISRGFAQANMIVLPEVYAYDFLLFAQRNPKPCPLLEVLDTGETRPRIAEHADIRTDIPKYRIWQDGELAEEVTDISDIWQTRDDLVTFLIGCSFTFEFPLMEAGIAMHHIDAGRNVPMYDTSIPCISAGVFSSSMVVSMRGIQANRIADAVRISGYYPSVHGAPLHVGDARSIGIENLQSPQYGDAPVLEDGDIPVFWACGVTPQAAVMASKPSFAITHAPGHMFITDAPDQRYMV
ncbi:putative hydro-lyase [Bifidobacterium crudilactis]|jgi:uncharacterized protein YcsI (UPF0317 family)|uniref:putative hydro-lyase n=1 Tax=Bifidobacterium crudilactis TaxID=327277 RepID=UPI002F35B85E